MDRRRCMISLILSLIGCTHLLLAQNESSGYRIEADISYYQAEMIHTSYQKERCKLDLYYPLDVEGFTTIVWFHGGGLRAGNKFIPEQLKEENVAIAAVNYRLHPKVKNPVYTEDAAASVAWVYNNIESFGGSSSRIFVSGHSAGGYLTSMIGLDKSYLEKHKIDADALAGLIPFSGHTITHFTLREEQGMDGMEVVVDDYAPLSHVRADAPPYIIITGDREQELLGRYEENAYMWRMMDLVGHPDCKIYELDGFNHGGMAVPAFPLLLKEVRRILKEKEMN